MKTIKKSIKNRHIYLRALGIQRWTLRHRAMSSLQVTCPTTDVLPIHDHNIQNQRRIKNVSQCDKATSLLNRPRTLNTMSEATLKTSIDIVPPFKLVVISVHPDILVVSDMPVRQQGQSVTALHQKLLYHLCCGLRWSINPEAQWSCNEIIWPLPALKNQSWQEACDAIWGFLNNLFGFSRRKRVLLLGTSSAQYVLKMKNELEKIVGVRTIDCGPRLGISYSLDQMLKVPALKARVWEHLSSFAMDVT